ncbi:hypothetical protein C7212DRAFT_318986, partial [Tuber magnatum]
MDGMPTNLGANSHTVNLSALGTPVPGRYNPLCGLHGPTGASDQPHLTPILTSTQRQGTVLYCTRALARRLPSQHH